MTIYSEQFPELYARSKNGKVKFWKIEVHDRGGKIYIVTRYGYQDGKIQETEEEITEGKNIGKSNETSPLQHAIMKANSKWVSKTDQKYIETIPSEDYQSHILLPMLATKYQENKDKIIFPCFIQPKLNGVRALSRDVSDRIVFTSRKFKEYHAVHHLHDPIKRFIGDSILDGELFHPSWTFQEILRNVKKETDKTKLIQYWVYDLAVYDVTYGYSVRHTWLINHLPKEDMRIIMTPTYEVHNEEELFLHHNTFTRQKFEGSIIRNKDGLYLFDYNSDDLQKLKDFDDEEFVIIGGKEGIGREKGCVVFECITPEGHPFSVRPRGSREKRKRWFKDLDNIVGKMLTVTYKDKSEDGIPLNLSGGTIRDYE